LLFEFFFLPASCTFDTSVDETLRRENAKSGKMEIRRTDKSNQSQNFVQLESLNIWVQRIQLYLGRKHSKWSKNVILS